MKTAPAENSAAPARVEPVEHAASVAAEAPNLPDSPLRLPLHVNARGVALGMIATVCFVFALQWAQKFLIPLVFAIFIAYTRNPLVAWLARIRIPGVAGVTVITGLILFGSSR